MSDGALPRVLVLHGPNLNLLGAREPAIYGAETLDAINLSLLELGRTLGIAVECAQSNHEGALIDRLHQARSECAAVVFNPGGYTHTSVALHDAIRAIGIPVVEVHLSNTSAREPFRHRSLTGAACVGRIEGLGSEGYRLALQWVARKVIAG